MSQMEMKQINAALCDKNLSVTVGYAILRDLSQAKITSYTGLTLNPVHYQGITLIENIIQCINIIVFIQS